MLRIVADEKIPFLAGVLEPYAEITYMPGNLICNEMIRDANALLVRTRTICDKHLLKGTSVKFIATATIGFDHIDTEYCQARNIAWFNSPGCNSSSVQQYMASALLILSQESNFDLTGKTIGIVGVGNVGSKVQRLAELFGMNVLLNDPPRARKKAGLGFVSLDVLLQNSDVVTLHVPLIKSGADKTLQLLNENRLSKMKTGAWLINTSRGEVAENDVVKQALLSGKLAGAMLDVWENEPGIDLELLGLVSLGTPHIAGYSADGKAKGTSMVVRSLSKHFGLPLTGFYPEQVPLPCEPELVIDGAGKSVLQVLTQAILYTYPIREDHFRLQQSPGTFELQRSNYPLRREFAAYTVNLCNGSAGMVEALVSLGFLVKKI
ncbi:MAG: 4-phosphoerythronate dehydrogenase [Bacteroidota bacterium]